MSHPNFTRFVECYRTHAKSDGDRRLLALFDAHAEAIGKHFDDSLQYVVDCLRKANSSEPIIHGFGATFHKGFRQHDVTPSGAIDIEVWHLLRGLDTCFWEVLASDGSHKK